MHFDAEAGGYLRRWRRLPWSVVRDREAAAVRRFLGRVDGLDALDLGCGAGYYTRLLLDLGARHVTSVDLSSAMLAELPGESVTPRQADAETVSFDTPFPVIVCAGLLEFVPDPVAVLKNARRACSPDGRLVLLLPAANAGGVLYRLHHRRNGISVRLFDRRIVTDAARAAGWSVTRIERAGALAILAELARRSDGVPAKGGKIV